jgi:hypothetical protein
LTSAALSSEILIMTFHKKQLAIAALAALTGWVAGPALFAPELAQAQGKSDGKGKPEDKGKPDDKGKPAASANPAASGANSGKPDDKPGPADSANPAATPGQDPDKAKAERKDRAKKERDELRVKVQAKLKNQPMEQALKEELQRHARRLARIARVKAVATTEKDDDAGARADKLLKKEQERHDKWMANYTAKAGAK